MFSFHFCIQSKKANFDASHELEELLLEDNPLKAKQRKDRDISTLSAEMRQMEEQFTIYDFRQMHRRSYYPHNQPIVTNVGSEGDEDPAPVVQSATNTLLPTATIVDRSQAGSPTPDPDRPRPSMHAVAPRVSGSSR